MQRNDWCNSMLKRTMPILRNASEQHRSELLVAGGRLLLASVALVGVRIRPTEPARFAAITAILLAGYGAYSLAVLFAIARRAPQLPQRVVLLTHAVDVVWPVILTLFAQRLPYLFFLWVLLSAAHRWGLRPTLLIAGACSILLFAEAPLLGAARLQQWLQPEHDIHSLALQAGYLLAMAAVIGVVGEKDKMLRESDRLIKRLIADCRADWGLTRSMEANLREITTAFGAASAILVCRRREPPEAALLRVLPGSRRSGGWQELSGSDAETYFRVQPPRRRGSASIPTVVYIRKRRRSAPDADWDKVFADVTSIWMTEPERVDEWELRLFLVNPTFRGRAARELLSRIVHQVSPALQHIYIARNLRRRAEVQERSRLARELHDGTMQSLFALRLQLGALRRRHILTPEVKADLDQIERLLRRETVGLRALMQSMADAQIEPAKLLEALAETVDKFQRESGIDGSFDSNASEIGLSRRRCRELVHIVEEALVNVQKHSYAHHVSVYLRQIQGMYLLTIKDDGCGFDFAGRLTDAQLEELHKGPLVIKRRVRSIGARLAIESQPGSGSVIEVVLAEPGTPGEVDLRLRSGL